MENLSLLFVPPTERRRNGDYYIYLSEEEHDVVIESLITWKNDLIRQGRYTDAIDDLLIKVIEAPKKRVKVN